MRRDFAAFFICAESFAKAATLISTLNSAVFRAGDWKRLHSYSVRFCSADFCYNRRGGGVD